MTKPPNQFQLFAEVLNDDSFKNEHRTAYKFFSRHFKLNPRCRYFAHFTKKYQAITTGFK
ncbi:hypothetical protein THIOM_002867 [Candidatus Thiomargarita nelsonii]|uniref:Uncharacterized protein n=1 Tax=Candidatus Thiomargarita nelsonii TaxID=1003181 RepID=A0A176S0D1_9GAMM|nr:hypothetical protein THIOM_002867 [Candidatus Thiomargarita nelsonii]